MCKLEVIQYKLNLYPVVPTRFLYGCAEEFYRCMYVPVCPGTHEKKLYHCAIEGLFLFLQRILCIYFTAYLEEVIDFWSGCCISKIFW